VPIRLAFANKAGQNWSALGDHKLLDLAKRAQQEGQIGATAIFDL
jgi:hypothetical protein